jgi:hypothetical protein
MTSHPCALFFSILSFLLPPRQFGGDLSGDGEKNGKNFFGKIFALLAHFGKNIMPTMM